MVDDNYYILKGGGPNGWRIDKYDAASMEIIDTVDVPLNLEYEQSNDQMLAYINGQLDASGMYVINVELKKPRGPDTGEATHHHFHSLDLEPEGNRILQDIPHVNGMSAIFVDDTYYFVTSTAWFGEIIVMKYDKDWNYLGTVETKLPGRWSQGIAYKDNLFYVAYVGTDKSVDNIVLAIFDKEWNLLGRTYVTDLMIEEGHGDRPHIMLFNDLVYVSYDVSENRDWKGIVNVYELIKTSVPP